MEINVISFNDKKLNNILEQGKTKNYPKIIHFPAVVGNNLDLQTLIEDKVITFNIAQNIKTNYRCKHHEIDTLGAVGCALSHIGLWEKMANSNLEKMVILEDDVILPDYNVLLETINKVNVDILFLNHRFAKKKNQIVDNIYTYTGNDVQSLGGYCITQQGAKKLLKYAFPITFQQDYYINFLKNNNLIDALIVEPAIINNKLQSPLFSTTQSKNICLTCTLPHSQSFYGLLVLILIILIIIVVILINKTKLIKIKLPF